MKKILTLVLVVFFTNGLSAQEVENAGFSKGKKGWIGDGEIVYINAVGEVSKTPRPGMKSALRVELGKNSWKEIKQKLHAKSGESSVTISFQVMAEMGFLRLPESRNYTEDVNFKEGGGYVLSVKMYPKCDFLIRLEDDTWYYRPISLAPVGSWKTVTETFDDLKIRQRGIELLFPPGEGSVLITEK